MSNDNEIFALIGRIHVLMRRNLNRITDVDYMQENKAYARTIAALAEGSGHGELVELAEKLRQAMQLDPLPEAAQPAPEAATKYLFTLR